jgi:hypothetical protein
MLLKKKKGIQYIYIYILKKTGTETEKGINKKFLKKKKKHRKKKMGGGGGVVAIYMINLIPHEMIS